MISVWHRGGSILSSVFIRDISLASVSSWSPTRMPDTRILERRPYCSRSSFFIWSLWISPFKSKIAASLAWSSARNADTCWVNSENVSARFRFSAEQTLTSFWHICSSDRASKRFNLNLTASSSGSSATDSDLIPVLSPCLDILFMLPSLFCFV